MLEARRLLPEQLRTRGRFVKEKLAEVGNPKPARGANFRTVQRVSSDCETDKKVLQCDEPLILARVESLPHARVP